MSSCFLLAVRQLCLVQRFVYKSKNYAGSGTKRDSCFLGCHAICLRYSYNSKTSTDTARRSGLSAIAELLVELRLPTVALTLGCRLANFYHLYLLFYYWDTIICSKSLSWKYSSGQKTVFTHSARAITPPKVNRFEWSLEHCEHIVGGWPQQILGAIRTVATVWQGTKILFFVRQVNSARFHPFPVGQILRHLNTTTSIGEAVKTFRITRQKVKITR